jgi:hypothetical protein
VSASPKIKYLRIGRISVHRNNDVYTYCANALNSGFALHPPSGAIKKARSHGCCNSLTAKPQQAFGPTI